MQFTVWSRSHLTSYIGCHKGGPCSLIQFHRTLIMKAAIEFLLLLLLLGEVGAIVSSSQLLSSCLLFFKINFIFILIFNFFNIFLYLHFLIFLIFLLMQFSFGQVYLWCFEKCSDQYCEECSLGLGFTVQGLLL